MKGKILVYVSILLAAALVFGAALFLDHAYGEITVETQPREPRVWETEETQTVPTETVETAPPETEPVETEPTEEVFLLTFAGDCTFGTQEANAQSNKGFRKVVGDDTAYPFLNFAEIFAADEFTMVNLEGVLSDEKHPITKANSFRGPAAYAKILSENSVEAVNLANDNAVAYSQGGYDATTAALQAENVSYAERDKASIFTTENGLKIAVYGAMFYSLKEETIAAEIAALKDQADIVIFAAHWGRENAYNPTDAQVTLAHAAIDAGADIVYGTHPHVLQPVEEYNGGIICYSLGNFSYGGSATLKDYDTAVIQQEVIREPDGTVHLGAYSVIPASCSATEGSNDYQPVPYEADSEEFSRVLSKLETAWKG